MLRAFPCIRHERTRDGVGCGHDHPFSSTSKKFLLYFALPASLGHKATAGHPGHGVTPVAGDVLTPECNGSSLVGKVNGVTVCSGSDSLYTGTQCGVVTLNNDGTMDNFKVLELA